jgi:hypothetical protein
LKNGAAAIHLILAEFLSRHWGAPHSSGGKIEKDDLGLIVTPLEEIGFGHRQTSDEDSGSGQSTIIESKT